MDLANLGEVSVLKVPIRSGRTEALLAWFEEAAAREGLWDLLSEQDVILRVFVERGEECDYLYSVKQGPDLLRADQILVEATGPFIEDRQRALSQALRSEQGIVLTHVADLAAPRHHVPPSAGGAR
jgi:hypothetical protein